MTKRNETWYNEEEEPVRAFPPQFAAETIQVAYDVYMDRCVTPLRALELAISVVYRRHKYRPSKNAYCYPERDLLEPFLDYYERRYRTDDPAARLAQKVRKRKRR